MKGFQRLLDPKRAREIAEYIDNGLGTIPSSIVLSAQPAADLKIVGKGKTLEFTPDKRAFLILDGQHRVFGFSYAKTKLRIPVVINSGLSRQDETRFFIDINTKQRPVPNELLLDIKKQADYESRTEQQLSELFDMFSTKSDSPLVGLMSPAQRSKNRISRVTFNAAVKGLLDVFGEREASEVYAALKAYLDVFVATMTTRNPAADITNRTLFRATMLVFPEVAQRVKDRHGSDYTVENFSEVLDPMLQGVKASVFSKPGNAIQKVSEAFAKALKREFTL